MLAKVRCTSHPWGLKLRTSATTNQSKCLWSTQTGSLLLFVCVTMASQKAVAIAEASAA